MKYINWFSISAIVLFFPASCAKNGEFTVHNKVINNSGVVIKIFPTGDTQTDTIILSNGASIEMAMPYLSGRGISKYAKTKEGIVFPYNKTGKIDFIFNNKDTVIHYKDSLTHEGKYLNKISDRCVFNDISHSYSIQKYPNNGYYKVVIYTITPQDYNFAKN